MSENGGLLSVATMDVVELPSSEGKRLLDGIDRTCNTVGDVHCAATGNKQLDGQTNGYNGLESCEKCCTDSGISNSADMDVSSIELLDDSEPNIESCSVYEENQTICADGQEDTYNASNHKDAYMKDAEINNVPNSLCSESKTYDEGTAETVLNCDPSAVKCTTFDGSCDIDTSAECSRDISVYDINDDDVLPASTVDESLQSHQDLVKSTGDDNALDVKLDNSTSHNDVPEVSFIGADEDNESCPNSTDVTTMAVENLSADKPPNEGNAVETSEITVLTSVATSQSQSHPTFTSSRSVPRPSRQSRPRMGSYGSPPPSATPSSSCPDDDTSKQQYVVNVHVNPGETFSVCVSDQVQLIQGNCAFLHLVIVNFKSVQYM